MKSVAISRNQSQSVAISRNQTQSGAIRRNQAHSSTDLLMKRLGEHLIRRNQAQSVVINGTQSHLLMKRLGEEPMRRLLLHHLMRRAIKRSSEVIKGASEGHQRGIRGSSEAHQRSIRGQSEGHQRVIRGAFTPGSVPPWAAVGMLEPRPRRSKGRTMARAKIRQGPSRAPRSVPDEGRNQGSLGGTHEGRFVKARLELRVAHLAAGANHRP